MYRNRTAHGAQEGNQFGSFGQRCGGYNAQKFGKQMPHWMQKFANQFNNSVPVNIEENDEAYTMLVYAAGLVKENFTVSVNDDVLSIAYKTEQNKMNESFSHQEFAPQNFERLFQLNTKVTVELISATYIDGVLKVTLPKNPETNRPAQKVDIR